MRIPGLNQTFAALTATALIGVGLPGWSWGNVDEVGADLVIKNVTVVDTADGSLARRMSVVVDDGEITQVAPSTQIRPDHGTRVVDGSGKYLVPGYLDMHTHSDPTEVATTPYFDLSLAYGVTGIREMAGDPAKIATAHDLNEARSTNDLAVPEMLQVGGPPISGIFTADQGRQAVAATKQMGADFVKVIFAGPAAVRAVLAEAEAEGLPVAGHLPPGISVVEAARSGWDSVEHLGASPGPIQLACSSDEDAIRTALVTGQGAIPPYPFPPTYTASPFLYSAGDAPWIQRAMDTYDAARCKDVVDTIIAEGMWQVPTMTRLRTMLRSDDPSLRRDQSLRYVSRETRATWNRLADEFTALDPQSARETFHAFFDSYETLMKLIHAEGGAATTMTGTDAGSSIWTVPGVALHKEFRELAAAGYTPLEVLQATTLNGARYLGREDTMGSVAEGKHADLVLLDANPLSSVSNLSRIAGVVNAGNYYSRLHLATLKSKIAWQAARGTGGYGGGAGHAH